MPERRAAVLALAAFLLVLCLLNAGTGFGRSGVLRYLLPAVPAVAVIVGVAVGAWSRLSPVAAGVALLLLLGIQVPVLRQSLAACRTYESGMRQARELGNELRSRGVEAVVADLKERWLNFALDEEFCFWPRPCRCSTRDIDADDEQLRRGLGYDHNWAPDRQVREHVWCFSNTGVNPTVN